MKAGTYQTDSLPRIVIVGGVWWFQRGGGTGCEKMVRLMFIDHAHQHRFQQQLYQVAIGPRNSFCQMTHEAPSRWYTGRFEIIRILRATTTTKSHLGRKTKRPPA